MLRCSFVLLFVSVIFLLSACRDDATPVPVLLTRAEETESLSPSGANGEIATGSDLTATPLTTMTEEPLAALVNGRMVLLIDFEKEVARHESAQLELGLSPDESGGYQLVVLDALIETELIAQAAEASGIVVSLEMIDQRLIELEETSGGTDNFNAWLEANQWTVDEFREALTDEMVTEKAVELVTADVPFSVEQVHARYLQVDDENLAQSLLEQIQGGEEFSALASQHSLDRLTGENGGDLGYFARGTLLVPEVEAIAFELQPGETSDVITGTHVDGTGTTYYIIQVIERVSERQLNPELRFLMLQETFEAWLAELWDQAEITRFVDLGG